MARIKPQALLKQSKMKKGPGRISVTTIVAYGLVLLVMVYFLFTTYRYWSTRSIVQTEDNLSTTEGMIAFHDLKKAGAPRYAVIDTSKGFITVVLDKEGSPEVVADFIDSCQKGQFRGMLFNRVIKNFVIHGGNVEGFGATEDWTARVKHHSQFDTSLKHEAFMLGTSKTRDDGEFDIFITTTPIPDINEKINVFGHVIKGEDVVQEIEEVDTDDHYRPKTTIRITDVTLKQQI